MPFSEAIRHLIFRRDQGKCQSPGCGRSFDDGFMLHAAHYSNHSNPSDPNRDTPFAGRLLCIMHHLTDHAFGTNSPEGVDKEATSLLMDTPIRTRKWYDAHGGYTPEVEAREKRGKSILLALLHK